MVTAAARARRRFGTAASVFIALAGLHGFIPPLPPVPAQAQDAAAAQNAKIWIDNRHAIEEYLRTAEVVKIDAIGVGVTSPRRAYLAPGGPFDSLAWTAHVRVTALDPAVPLGIGVLLLVAACVGALIPCARAARVDPIVTLRE